MNNEVMKLNWIGTKARGSHGGNDVTITTGLQGGHDERPYVNFIFRNGVSKLFSDTDYVLFAKFKNRIFFKAGDSNNGITLSKNKNASEDTRYARIQRANINEQFAVYAGDYELKYDEFYELYYIEREDKEE